MPAAAALHSLYMPLNPEAGLILQATFSVFRSECRRRGLRCRERRVEPCSGGGGAEDGNSGGGGDGGVMGRRCDYEGGFLMMALDHEAAPCTQWHSEDFGPQGQ